MNMRDGAHAALQGRELQEAASGARPKTGGTSHAVGCRFTSIHRIRSQKLMGTLCFIFSTVQ